MSFALCRSRVLRATFVALSLLVPVQAAHAELANLPAGSGQADAGTLAGGVLNACAILTDGGLRCWGYGNYGQLGLGTTDTVGDDEQPSAAPVVPVGGPVSQVAVGERHTCALLESGGVRCWGQSGDTGAVDTIGDDEPASAAPLVALPAGRNVRQLIAGSMFSCALLDDGTVRCWGSGSAGRLGNGSTADAPASAPAAVALPAGRTATAISGRASASACALLDTGAVACWGSAENGALLNGSGTENVGDDPGETAHVIALPVGRTARALASGYTFHCALLDGGEVQCWGAYPALVRQNMNPADRAGSIDHLGDAAGELPRTIPVGGEATGIFASAGGVCATLADGSARCWGYNLYGELGLGTSYYGSFDPVVGVIGDDAAEVPVPQTPPAGLRIVAAEGLDSTWCFLLSDRTARCLGANGAGQLGIGSTTSYGDDPGETFGTATSVGIGALLGRDRDGDGLRDAVDACPTAASTTATGCAPSSTGGTPPPPGGGGTDDDAVTVTIRGRTLTLSALVRPTQQACPRRATVRVSLPGARLAQRRLRTRKAVGTKARRCRVAGTLRLSRAVKAGDRLTLRISGKGIVTRQLRKRPQAG